MLVVMAVLVVVAVLVLCIYLLLLLMGDASHVSIVRMVAEDGEATCRCGCAGDVDEIMHTISIRGRTRVCVFVCKDAWT